MKTEHFKQRLLAEEQKLLTLIKRAEASAREGAFDSVHDLGDESVNDVLTEEQLKEADTYWAELKQVRDALQRAASTPKSRLRRGDRYQDVWRDARRGPEAARRIEKRAECPVIRWTRLASLAGLMWAARRGAFGDRRTRLRSDRSMLRLCRPSRRACPR